MPAGRLLSTSLTAGSDAVPDVVGGEGVYFELADGRRVIDASNTAAPLGHAHPEIIAAIKGAASAPAVNEGWGWKERELAAEALVGTALAGEDWVGAVRFFISASEANDVGMALAQALTGRPALATRERAYHGGLGLAREMTVQPQWHGGLSSQDGIKPAPRLADVRILPAPSGARITGQPDPTAGDDWQERAAADLAESAAVLLDYSQGGVYHTPAYQDQVAALARDAGTIWIADETVTGFGRVGGWFQFQHGESRPDMISMGKCLAAGGSAAGALVLSQDLVDRLDGTTWQTYSSYRGHPLQVATVRAHIEVSAREGLYRRAEELDPVLERGLAEIAERHPAVRRIDGRGLHWTVELHGPDWREWRGEDAEPLASRIAARALDAGVLFATSGEQTSIFIAPPLIVSEEEIEEILEALDHSLELADSEFETTRAGA